MNAAPAIETIRKATLADIPFIRELAKERYPDRNVEEARAWMEWCIAHPDRLVLVGPNSIGVARLELNYGFERRAGMDMLGARPGSGWEAFRMVRMMLQWARENGAKGNFKLDADTGVDFAPFARRLGGRESPARWYEIPL